MAEQRGVIIRFRMTEDEAEQLNNAVNASGMTRSSYIRTLLKGKQPKTLPPKEYYALMNTMRDVENDINNLNMNLRQYNMNELTEKVSNVCNEVSNGIITVTNAVIRPEKKNTRTVNAM